MLYLVGEIALLLVVASLLGAFVGYLRWGRRPAQIVSPISRETQAHLAQFVLLERRLLEAAEEAARRDSELKHALDDISKHETERLALLANADELSRKSSELDTELNRQRTLVALRDDRVAALEQQLTSAAQEVEERTLELRVTEARVAEVEADGLAQARASADLAARLEVVEAERDDVRGRLEAREAQLTTLEAQLAAAPPPLPADDLELINGVGPAASDVLKRIGLGDFKSIATVDDDLFEALESPLLRFKTRMAREDWAGQARHLHRIKYGIDAE